MPCKEQRIITLQLHVSHRKILQTGQHLTRHFWRKSSPASRIHPSLIPAFCGTGYYGLKVHEGVLKRGVKVTGATVHFVDKGTDTGPIIIQKAVEVQQDDTPEILQRRVMEQAEWKIMPQAIRLIAEGKVRVENGKTIITE